MQRGKTEQRYGTTCSDHSWIVGDYQQAHCKRWNQFERWNCCWIESNDIFHYQSSSSRSFNASSDRWYTTLSHLFEHLNLEELLKFIVFLQGKRMKESQVPIPLYSY